MELSRTATVLSARDLPPELVQNVGRSDSAWRNRTSGRSSKGDEKEDLAASDKHGDLKYLWREIETMKARNRAAAIPYVPSETWKSLSCAYQLPGCQPSVHHQAPRRVPEQHSTAGVPGAPIPPWRGAPWHPSEEVSNTPSVRRAHTREWSHSSKYVSQRAVQRGGNTSSHGSGAFRQRDSPRPLAEALFPTAFPTSP